MLKSYFQNADLKMTKDQYFEMCEMMGNEPIEQEIPVELQDFPDEVQTAFTIYYMLQDVWDPMGGSYLGKNYSIVFDLFRVYMIENEEQLFMLSILQRMDYERQIIVSEKQKAAEASRQKS